MTFFTNSETAITLFEFKMKSLCLPKKIVSTKTKSFIILTQSETELASEILVLNSLKILPCETETTFTPTSFFLLITPIPAELWLKTISKGCTL